MRTELKAEKQMVFNAICLKLSKNEWKGGTFQAIEDMPYISDPKLNSTTVAFISICYSAQANFQMKDSSYTRMRYKSLAAEYMLEPPKEIE